MYFAHISISSDTILVPATPSPSSTSPFPPLSQLLASAVLPPDVRSPRKRCRRSPLPQLDAPAETIIPRVVIPEAMAMTTPVRLRRMVEPCRWAFAMDSIGTWRYQEGEPKYEIGESSLTEIHLITVARIESDEQGIETLCARAEWAEEQVAVLQDLLGTAGVRIADLKIRAKDVEARMEQTMPTTRQGLSSTEIEQIVAQRVANAIEAIAIYETKTRVARDSMDRVVRQGAKIMYRVDGDDFIRIVIMPPRMRTRSAGRHIAKSRGGGRGEQVGRGGRGRGTRGGNNERVDELNGQGNNQGSEANGDVEGVNGNVEGVNEGVGGAPDFSTIIAQQLQNFLPAMLAQVGNQGNVGNQNGNVVNENVQENVGNVLVNGNRWNSRIRTLSQEVAVSMSWNDFKFMMIEEFCPSHEMKKLETELWNHAMVGAGHAAYTDRFHELARLVPHLVTLESQMIERYVYGLALQIRGMVAATDPKTIQKAVQISSALTDEAV
ncbi:reverse transcriptase domain-containing protein [Tanacetum coccineum]|uniref:Reverse transcriptase domain-containing protein n=1 Tax=Tanacetum coccineum TaxID=301880 RepID=A0ABQ5BRS4_9ASTR